nr:SDR family oxidoreductase [Robbsia betulipollinis]
MTNISKNWLITGTSTGLGRLLTERLLARGDHVAATVRVPAVLDDLASRYPDTLRVFVLDITDTPAVRATVDAAFAAMPRIDIVVGNAGYGLFGAAEEVTDAQIDRQIATNLTGAIQLIRAVLPHLRHQQGGRIVQLSSEGGQIAYPNFSVYHASKWGIEGFVESVAQEVAPFGIDFLLVEPGPTRTSFVSGLVRAESMAEYDDTPAGAMRRALDSGTFTIKGDAYNTVEAIIAAGDAVRPPLRLALGSTAYASIHTGLINRLDALEAQKDRAFAADATAPRPGA